jgi:hypothetical protein
MRRAGRESWRFAHDIDQTLHALLYIRDTLDLTVDQGPTVPPHLTGDLPQRSGLLDADARHQAALDWPSWWSNALRERPSIALGSRPEGTDQRLWMRELAERYRLVADPPEWASLLDHRVLQEAARTLYVEGCRWADAARRPLLPPACHDIFKWGLLRAVAEDCAARHQVSVGAVNGCALVFIVEGIWWETISPGGGLLGLCGSRPRKRQGRPARGVRVPARCLSADLGPDPVTPHLRSRPPEVASTEPEAPRRQHPGRQRALTAIAPHHGSSKAWSATGAPPARP